MENQGLWQFVGKTSVKQRIKEEKSTDEAEGYRNHTYILLFSYQTLSPSLSN